jgi:hypothetical protein
MWAVPRVHRLFFFLSLLFVIVLRARAADAAGGGWTEVHETADDVRVVVAPNGIATIEHRLRFRIVAGKFKSFDVSGIDPHAELTPDSVIIPEQGDEIPARVEASPKLPGTVRISFDVPKGLRRGTYVVPLSYKLDLALVKALVRDGAMWKLAWTAPPAPEGRDGARITFELPPAPSEPRLANPDEAATTLATLRRMPDKDELELVRTHVPRGEAVVWSARVDPKAFPAVAAPELKPAMPVAIAAQAAPPNRVPAAILASTLATLAGLFALVLMKKRDAVVAVCAAQGAAARALVPVPRAIAPFVYALLAAGGLAALLWGTPLHGALAIVAAMALASFRRPMVVARPRGPGRWERVGDEHVLLPQPRAVQPGDALDAGTTRGKLVLLAIGLCVAAASFFLRLRVPGAAIAIPVASCALAPIFFTGTRAQMPRSPSELASGFLRPVRDALARAVDLAHVDVCCSARFREGAARSFDEVRLACGPRDRIPGLRAIELAFAGALPEVLVRYADATEAAAKIAAIAPKVPIVPGRVPEEKVLRLAPTTPTAVASAKLLAKLLVELEGRRAGDRAGRAVGSGYAGPERRRRTSVPVTAV